MRTAFLGVVIAFAYVGSAILAGFESWPFLSLAFIVGAVVGRDR